MTTIDKITESASEIRRCLIKAKVLTDYVLDELDAPDNYYTLVYFIRTMLDEIDRLSDDIEIASFKLDS